MLITPLYVNDDDSKLVLEWLNVQPDLAFLLPTGESCWQAITRLPTVPLFPIDLWQVSAGPLPYFQQESSVSRGAIPDPFAGWSGRAESFKPTRPFFGACPHTLHLDINTVSKYSWEGQRRIGPNVTNTLGLSSFAWQGDYNKTIGYPAHPETKRLWSRLRRFVRSTSERVGAGDWLVRKDFYAFPGAHEDIKSGRPRAPAK